MYATKIKTRIITDPTRIAIQWDGSKWSLWYSFDICETCGAIIYDSITPWVLSAFTKTNIALFLGDYLGEKVIIDVDLCKFSRFGKMEEPNQAWPKDDGGYQCEMCD